MSIYISFNRESFKKPTTGSSIGIERNPSVFIPFVLSLFDEYRAIHALYHNFECTLISYYKKNKFFQFKRKKEVQSWESFLNKRLLELSKTLIILYEVPQYLIRSTSTPYIPLKIFRRTLNFALHLRKKKEISLHRQ